MTALPIWFVLGMEYPPLWFDQALFLLPNVLLADGGFPFVALGVLFYVFRRWRFAQIAGLATLATIFYTTLNPSSPQWMMVFAAIPMLLYSGEKGRGMKSFFYIFYPAHIYALYIIATLWKTV